MIVVVFTRSKLHRFEQMRVGVVTQLQHLWSPSLLSRVLGGDVSAKTQADTELPSRVRTSPICLLVKPRLSQPTPVVGLHRLHSSPAHPGHWQRVCQAFDTRARAFSRT